GNFDRWETQGALQTAVVNDLLAVRVAYTYIKDDGVIKNVHPGVGDLDQTDVFGIRGSMLFTPSSNFEAVLRVNHYSSTGATAASLPINMNFAAIGLTNIANTPGVNRAGLGYFENNQD